MPHQSPHLFQCWPKPTKIIQASSNIHRIVSKINRGKLMLIVTNKVYINILVVQGRLLCSVLCEYLCVPVCFPIMVLQSINIYIYIYAVAVLCQDEQQGQGYACRIKCWPTPTYWEKYTIENAIDFATTFATQVNVLFRHQTVDWVCFVAFVYRITMQYRVSRRLYQ